MRRRRRPTAGSSAATPVTATTRQAIADPAVDAVVVAVPPRFHLDLTLQALAAGKHVLVEKPAFLRIEDYRAAVRGARSRASASCWSARTITTSRWPCTLRRLLAGGVIGEMVFAHFTTIAQAAEDRRTTGATTRRWPAATRSSRKGFTGCTSPAASARRSSTIHGYRPSVSRERSGQAREEHDGGVPLRQRRGRIALLLARDSVAVQGPAAVEAVRPRRRHHVRIERRCSSSSRGNGVPRLRLPGLSRHPRLPGDVSRFPAARSASGARPR